MRCAHVLLVGFVVACSSSPSDDGGHAALTVSVVSTGPGVIPAGYELVVDGTRTVTVAANGATRVDGLAAGKHTVQFKNPGACTPDWYAPREVTASEAGTGDVAFTVDCRMPLEDRILFVDGSSREIISIRPDGTDRRVMGPGQQLSAPMLSPAGTRILYTLSNQVWVMNADGTDQRSLTNDPTKSITRPSWSPDGTRIVYVTGFGDATSIVEIYADGRGAKTLATDGANDPRWAPDGRRLAFLRRQELDVLDLATGTILNVRPPDSTGYVRAFAWSPAGDRIAYQAARFDAPRSLRIGLVRLSERRDTILVRDISPVGNAIAWSPNGEDLLFSAWIAEASDIFRMSLQNGGLVNLTNTPTVIEYFPTWAR